MGRLIGSAFALGFGKEQSRSCRVCNVIDTWCYQHELTVTICGRTHLFRRQQGLRIRMQSFIWLAAWHSTVQMQSASYVAQSQFIPTSHHIKKAKWQYIQVVFHYHALNPTPAMLFFSSSVMHVVNRRRLSAIALKTLQKASKDSKSENKHKYP